VICLKQQKVDSTFWDVRKLNCTLSHTVEKEKKNTEEVTKQGDKENSQK
jgi:hypothetical protein